MAAYRKRNLVTHYDLCIVGAGLIGSAAARHATLAAPRLKVCLIGPKEPKDRHQCKHGIFGAHYDEGRITRLFDKDRIWAELSKRSIERYNEIEVKSGKYYLKVGHGKQYERELRTPEEVSDWYKTEGDKNALKPLLDGLFQFVRGVTPVSTQGDCCVTTHTPTCYPYCDMITPLLGIIVGGNGYAAKSADEIGRMGARMIIAGKWDHDLPQQRFKAKFKVDKNRPVSRL
ncbi:uncharacterized protein [Ptychodera flava]|uniref:uncharacterized protein n=1 Tax=Ptychodera flava TaxID=63121 RepID=UPI00396A55BD